MGLIGEMEAVPILEQIVSRISMANVSAVTSNESLPIFEMWLSQWRLATLDCDPAKPVLAFVLDAMRTRPGHNDFLAISGTILQSSHEGNRFAGTPILDTAEIARLARQVKLLLKHMGRNYSLNGEDLVFWQLVEQALKCDATPDGEQHGTRPV